MIHYKKQRALTTLPIAQSAVGASKCQRIPSSR
jgi:hypothetical protein